jgi:uncharacterized Fe-S cluster-containing radical SAM superfamily enzyme
MKMKKKRKRMSDKPKRTERIMIRVTTDEAIKCEAIAHARDCSMSDVLRLGLARLK